VAPDTLAAADGRQPGRAPAIRRAKGGDRRAQTARRRPVLRPGRCTGA
jgi:hypothetical protein